MMRMLARLHGQEYEVKGGRTRLSFALGVITSGIVIAHLGALGLAGALLFVRSGDGYSTGETILLAGLTTVAILAFGRTGYLRVRRRHLQTEDGGRQ